MLTRESVHINSLKTIVLTLYCYVLIISKTEIKTKVYEIGSCPLDELKLTF